VAGLFLLRYIWAKLRYDIPRRLFGVMENLRFADLAIETDIFSI
jgi:hypothetical protein